MNIRRCLRLESESERFREMERKVGEKKKSRGVIGRESVRVREGD